MFHAIVGTASRSGWLPPWAFPLAILTAVYLSEVGGFGARAVRIVVTAMSGVPAIVAGLFIYTFWVIHQVLRICGFARSGAPAPPDITRGTEEVLKIVPNDLREASTRVGGTRMAHHVVGGAPHCPRGLITAVLLGIGGRTG